MKDLFETPEKMPLNLFMIVEKWENKIMDGLSYKQIGRFLDQVETVGYTFDYYLDAEPYGLRKIGIELNQLEGYQEM